MNKKKKKKTTRKPLARSGTSFEYQINCYQGCEHGCRYCYGRRRPYKMIPYDNWVKAEPRSDTPRALREQLNGMRQATKDKVEDIFVCSACDAYQPMELGHKITRRVIRILKANEFPFTILTKNTNVLRDINLLKGYDKCRVGFTIITLDDDFRKLLEPNSSSIADRCEALRALKKAGISTYCSVEPIMPDKRSDPSAVVNELKDCVDLFEFGMWNPYGKKKFEEETGIIYSEDYYIKVFSKLIPYLEQEGVRYCIAKHSNDFLRFHGFRFIPAQLVTGRPYLDPMSGDYSRCVVQPVKLAENPIQTDRINREVDEEDLSKKLSPTESSSAKTPTKPRRIKLNKKGALEAFKQGKSAADFPKVRGITKPTLNRYYREWKSSVSEEDEIGRSS